MRAYPVVSAATTLLPHADSHVFLWRADQLVLHEPIIAHVADIGTLFIAAPAGAQCCQELIAEQIGVAHVIAHADAELVLQIWSHIQLERGDER